MLITHYASWIYTAFVTIARPFGVFMLLPMLSSKNLGGSLIRNGLVVMVCVPIFPALNQTISAADLNDSTMHYALLIAKEVMVGLFIGFIAAIPFWAMDSACYMIDTMRGSSMASALNPALGESSTLFGVLFSQLITVLFFGFGGFNHLLTALYQSYQLIPPGTTMQFNNRMLVFIKQQWDMLFSMMLIFALPAMGVMLLTDIGMGLLNRSVQQMNIFFLAMPIKSALVLFLLIISIPFSIRLYQQHILHVSDNITAFWKLQL